MKKVGRPTKLTPEAKEIIIKSLKCGLSYKETCIKAGISEETFNQWRKQFPEFSELVDVSELEFKVIALKSIQLSMLRDWRAAAWWLERRYPEEFRQKKEIDIDDRPILIQDIM